jgi:hypothetical protein
VNELNFQLHIRKDLVECLVVCLEGALQHVILMVKLHCEGRHYVIREGLTFLPLQLPTKLIIQTELQVFKL